MAPSVQKPQDRPQLREYNDVLEKGTHKREHSATEGTDKTIIGIESRI